MKLCYIVVSRFVNVFSDDFTLVRSMCMTVERTSGSPRGPNTANVNGSSCS